MHLTVNGDGMELEAPLKVDDLLTSLGVDSRPCAVEVNRAIVPRDEHAAHLLQDGDVIEIVTLVGGG